MVNGRSFSPKLIAFDKDGTLVNFHHLWGQKTLRWVEAMVTQVGGDESLRVDLWRTLGFSQVQNRVVPDGPVAVASNPKIYGVAAAVLYQHGLGWHQAEAVAHESGSRVFGALPTADLIQPIGDVTGTMRRLHEADIRLAIITSDDRLATQATLPLLGIRDYVDILVCGDDPLPNKPDPAGLLHVARTLGVALDDMAMVGDTKSDILFGRNAGVGWCVGVVGGAGDEVILAETADLLVHSIEAIKIDESE